MAWEMVCTAGSSFLEVPQGGLVTQAAFPLRGRDYFLLFLLILRALLTSVEHPLAELARPELATCHGC